MSMIRTFNTAVSDAINKGGEEYTTIIGDVDFEPEATIVNSEDYNCGALCNELEFLRTVSNYYVRSFDLDQAESENLNELVETFLDLPRRNFAEPDATYRKRFRSIAVQNLNRRRTTKWSIRDALKYFISTADTTVQIIEIFELNNTYFELRVEGTVSYEGTIFLDSTEQGFLDQNFVGGSGVGEVISYLGEIVDRIKAAGVDYDIIFISQSRFTKTVDVRIGTIQTYKSIDATVKASISLTKNINATVV